MGAVTQTAAAKQSKNEVNERSRKKKEEGERGEQSRVMQKLLLLLLGGCKKFIRSRRRWAGRGETAGRQANGNGQAKNLCAIN